MIQKSRHTLGIALFSAIVTLGSLTASCKPFTPGKMVEHKFDVSPEFTAISTNTCVDVVFTQSGKDSDFEVRGKLPENLIDRMEVKVKGNILYITMKDGEYNMEGGKKSPTVYITNKALKDVQSSGSGDFVINGDLKIGPDGLTVKNSGSGDFKSGKLIAGGSSVGLSVTGSGDIDIDEVESSTFKVSLSGSADVDCGRVITQTCKIALSGSGDIKIKGSTDSVKFALSGTGNIDAANFQAKEGSASVSGVGHIRCNVERLSDRVGGVGKISNRHAPIK